MTRHTGLSSVPRSRVPQGRVVVTATVLIAASLIAPAISADSGHTPRQREVRQSSPEREAALDLPMAMIAAAFRTEKPEPIRSLLPAEGKVYFSLDAAGCTAGYYSRDQVYFILSGIFRRHDTIRFTIRAQRSGNPSPGLVYCIGTWSFHRHDGLDGESQIHFILSNRKGSWSLAEIREAL